MISFDTIVLAVAGIILACSTSILVRPDWITQGINLKRPSNKSNEEKQLQRGIRRIAIASILMVVILLA